ncbi:MAG TPA: carbon monoxide dehydrogenase subunit G [Candidatus Binataceae bacterium]|nr:carbon monoxide dehydrogenase subunit G [Candidatus Binataceae bacterium]
MRISGEQTLPAPRQRVWDLFNDPNRLVRLIPGCEKLDQLASDEFAGTINVGIAGIKGSYAGRLKLEEMRPPEHYKMMVDGKGKQGFMRGFGTLDLAPAASNGNQTVVRYSGDVQIGGPLVQVGQRVIDSAAKMMLGQFFAAAEAELRAEAQGTIARQGFFINLWRYLTRILRSRFSRGR